MKKFLFISFLLILCTGYSQSKKIKILQADNTMSDPRYPGATISLGNVFIEHEGATLRCDKAYIYQKTKFIKAMGNVVINQGDTVFQYSKYTDYDGLNKKSVSWGDVFLKDETMELRTDTLYFDREKQHLFYKNGGTIKDTTNVLKSKIGNYYLANNKFQAFTNVEVVNPDSKLVSNHLDYYTDTGIAELYGPSNITSEKDSVYTERGHYNSKTNISYFLKTSRIFYEDRTIEGDSLYYNKVKGFASATGNIKVVDTINETIIKGGYAELFKEKDSVYITDKAVAITAMDKDSVYIHGNILMVTGKTDERVIRAFNHVKYFKTNLQGKCDSLVTNEKTGLTELLQNPVIWAEGNQITGDTIHLISNVKTEQLDSLKILNNGFMVQKDSIGFSQMKGKYMFGKFKGNSLISLDVVGNSEVVFFGRDESKKLVGITKMRASKNIFITLEKNEISAIDFFVMPDGKTYPPSQLPEQDRKLKGFVWREDERPITKEDIFILGKIPSTKNKKDIPKVNELQKNDLKID